MGEKKHFHPDFFMTVAHCAMAQRVCWRVNERERKGAVMRGETTTIIISTCSCACACARAPICLPACVCVCVRLCDCTLISGSFDFQAPLRVCLCVCVCSCARAPMCAAFSRIHVVLQLLQNCLKRAFVVPSCTFLLLQHTHTHTHKTVQTQALCVAAGDNACADGKIHVCVSVRTYRFDALLPVYLFLTLLRAASFGRLWYVFLYTLFRCVLPHQRLRNHSLPSLFFVFFFFRSPLFSFLSFPNL